MKVIVNYDIMERVRTANKGFKLEKLVGRIAFSALPPFALYAFSNYPNNVAIAGLSGYAVSTIVALIVLHKYSPIIDEAVKEEADDDLKDLTNKLLSLGVNTSSELLKTAELLEKNVSFSEDELTIKQDKYIVIPQTNGYEETIYQEHILGSDEYELSVGSPHKRLVLKPAKQP